MEEEYNIHICDGKDVQTIYNGINEYNLKQVPAASPNWTAIEYIVKNKEGLAIGGIIGGMGYWLGLEIKILWVNKDFRGQGIGSSLLQFTEKKAKELGATISMLDTFSFQAEDFYLKNGYVSFGEIKDFPNGHRRIYFSKKLV